MLFFAESLETIQLLAEYGLQADLIGIFYE